MFNQTSRRWEELERVRRSKGEGDGRTGRTKLQLVWSGMCLLRK